MDYRVNLSGNSERGKLGYKQAVKRFVEQKEHDLLNAIKKKRISEAESQSLLQP